MKQFARTLDLKDDPQLIAQYEEHHQRVWPEVLAAIKNVGIVEMKIFRAGTRMFMLMETTDEYDEAAAAQYLSKDPKSIEWEALMDNFQKPVPGAAKDVKWLPMTCCFELSKQ